MIDVYIDGASAGNPGYSGAGVWIKIGNGKTVELSIPLPEMSNHEAEYEALLYALTYCLEHDFKEVSFRTDSQLIDQALEKQFVKNKKYQPYLKRALALIEQFDLFFMLWIPSQKNKQADRLARKAILEQKGY
ncbi:reverse transcriptase-like protein [Alkalihalobacillus pseudalcaliphilus]|uniref:reverse transcriptase-like protein n=1 Tax=Alkalihalobacillus pseudalcaliphilus TaxID=79884 RepID=UPI00064DEF11|nr:reverse transcriptase-like protein [Alkalihalobacillus pseudalcaliphilus]KMK76355.1 ribonuclease H [Alkalihalobacillus pseudalcaliphilus]